MRNLTATPATLVLAGTLAVGLAACGGGSSGGGSSAQSVHPQPTPAAAKTAVTHLYETFFNSPVAQAKTMLEDGASLGAAFKVAQKIKGNATETAKVHSVTLVGTNGADVKYELATNGNTVLPDADGKAVYVN